MHPLFNCLSGVDKLLEAYNAQQDGNKLKLDTNCYAKYGRWLYTRISLLSPVHDKALKKSEQNRKNYRFCINIKTAIYKCYRHSFVTLKTNPI